MELQWVAKEMSFQENTAGSFDPSTAVPIRALVLDDDAFDRSRIRRFTEKSDLDVEIQEAQSLSAMADILGREAFDLIMVDYNLAEGDGLDALEMIQRDQNNKDAAVIMISGQERTSLAVSAFRQGCQDFLTKNELTVESLRHSMVTAMSQSDVRHIFNPMGSAAFQQAVEAAVIQSLQGEKVQAALAQGLRAITQSPVQSDVVTASEDISTFVIEFLTEEEFHFNSLSRES